MKSHIASQDHSVEAYSDGHMKVKSVTDQPSLFSKQKWSHVSISYTVSSPGCGRGIFYSFLPNAQNNSKLRTNYAHIYMA